MNDFITQCKIAKRELHREDPKAPWHLIGSDKKGAYNRITDLVLELVYAADRLDVEDEVPVAASEVPQELQQAISTEQGISTAIKFVGRLRRWADALLTAASKPQAKGDKQPAKRTGRRRKDETGGATLVISALAQHHQYEAGGSVLNHEPCVVRKLAADHDGLSTATISRFLTDKFGKDGYKQYVAVCRRGGIGLLLAKWQGETPDWQPEYKDGIEQSEDDRHRHGDAPGSKRDYDGD